MKNSFSSNTTTVAVDINDQRLLQKQSTGIGRESKRLADWDGACHCPDRQARMRLLGRPGRPLQGSSRATQLSTSLQPLSFPGAPIVSAVSPPSGSLSASALQTPPPLPSLLITLAGAGPNIARGQAPPPRSDAPPRAPDAPPPRPPERRPPPVWRREFSPSSRRHPSVSEPSAFSP